MILAAVLLLAAALRLPVLDWGLPPTTVEVAASDIRSSYAFDEDDILTGVSFARTAQFDFDPRRYHWGMLHFHLLQILLDGAEAVGYFEQPWRESYYNLIPGEFERVYALARGLSVLFGLLGVLSVYLLTRDFCNRTAALWAAAITGASAAHLLGSAQIRVDLTMVGLVTLAAWLGLRALRMAGPGWLFAFGVMSGFAFSANYPALLVVAPMLLVVLHSRRYAPRAVVVALAGLVTGTLVGAAVPARAMARSLSAGFRYSSFRPTDPAPICALTSGAVVATRRQPGAIRDRPGCRAAEYCRHVYPNAPQIDGGRAHPSRTGRQCF